jgi:hypothetical protein
MPASVRDAGDGERTVSRRSHPGQRANDVTPTAARFLTVAAWRGSSWSQIASECYGSRTQVPIASMDIVAERPKAL